VGKTFPFHSNDCTSSRCRRSNSFQVNNSIDFCLPLVYDRICSRSKTVLSSLSSLFSRYFATAPLARAQPVPGLPHSAFSLLPTPFLPLRAGTQRARTQAEGPRPAPSAFAATGSQRAAVARRESTSGAKIHTMSTYTIAISKPFRMCTCRKMGPPWGAQQVYLQDELLRVSKVGGPPPRTSTILREKATHRMRFSRVTKSSFRAVAK